MLTRPPWKPAKRCLGKRVLLWYEFLNKVLPTYLPQITMIIVYEIMNIWKSYMWSAEPEELFEGRSSQLYTQLMQLRKESLKKIQACTGFGPLTCCDTGAALSVRVIILSRVYNEAIQRPSPSWLVNLIGRALHRYRRGQGFESRTSLNFLQVFISQLHKLRI